MSELWGCCHPVEVPDPTKLSPETVQWMKDVELLHKKEKKLVKRKVLLKLKLLRKKKRHTTKFFSEVNPITQV